MCPCTTIFSSSGPTTLGSDLSRENAQREKNNPTAIATGEVTTHRRLTPTAESGGLDSTKHSPQTTRKIGKHGQHKDTRPRGDRKIRASTYLRESLDDKEHFLVRLAAVLEVGALGDHTALGGVHEPQKVDGAQLDRLEDLSVNPCLNMRVMGDGVVRGERWCTRNLKRCLLIRQ